MAVGGEDAGEEAEVIGDASGGVVIGGGGEIDGAAGGLLLLEVLEELAVVGQVGDVELNGGGDLALEGSFAFEEPSRKFEDGGGAMAGDSERGVVEGI